MWVQVSQVAQHATGKHAWAICDICGFRYPYRSLRQQIRDSRKTSLWVCSECVDKDVPRRLGPVSDPQALKHPRPDYSLEPSRRILHWKPVDGFLIKARLGGCEVITDAVQVAVQAASDA